MNPENPAEGPADEGVLLTMADAPAVAWLLSIRPREMSPPPPGSPDTADESPADVGHVGSPNLREMADFTPRTSVSSAPATPEFLRDPTRWATPSAGLDLPAPSRQAAATQAFDSLGRDGRPVDFEVRPDDLPNWPMPGPVADLAPAPRPEARPVPAWRDQIDRSAPANRDTQSVERPGPSGPVVRQGLLPTSQEPPFIVDRSRSEPLGRSTTPERLRAGREEGSMRESLPSPLGMRRREPLG
ncbi:hypothetical protein EP7_004948 [Isosphaeraceae bacterium EP7]